MQVGGLDVVPVLDGSSHPPLGEIVAAEDREWDCPAHPLDEQGRLTLDLGAYLIRGHGRTVLVDAGIGTVTKAGHTSGALPGNLARLGVGFDDITDVLFTHLHWDHVGWATQKGRVVFPRATYRVHRDDWDHFVGGPQALPGAVKKLTPIVPHLQTFDAETELAPGIIARPAPGHTPGSTVYMLADAGERALLFGDVTHTVAELTDPEWNGLYDLDPVAAREVRNRFATEAADLGDLVAAAHFPGLRFGRLVHAGSGRRRFGYV